MADWWKNTSLPDASLMKPKPLSDRNVLIVPFTVHLVVRKCAAAPVAYQFNFSKRDLELRREGSGRIRRSGHLAFSDFALRENGCRVSAVDSRTTASRQLRRSQRRDCDELERPHQLRWTDHRAPAANPKNRATGTPMIAAPTKAKRTLRLTATSC
jgi:hypothetical protein